MQTLRDESGALVADISPPIGATDRRPIVVALHGGGDAPEYACGEWRGSFGPWPFILCPYGAKVAAKLYGWASGAQARAAVERALVAIAARYPQHADLRNPVLTGFSRGAMVGPATLVAPGTRFPVAIFVEGHTADFGVSARRFADAGLQRLLFVDSQGGNAARARTEVAMLERAGKVKAQAIYVGPLGHGFFPKTAEGVRKGLAELLAGLPAWQTFPLPPVQPN